MSNAIKIGCDPEFFLEHPEFGFISAHDMVPGTKENPFKLDGGAVQADGTAVEFNIDPTTNAKEFSERIIHVLKQVREMIDPVLRFRFLPTVRYKPEYFESLPEFSKELGCTPDYNAHKDGAVNVKPDNSLPMRTGAGHIHIGWTEDKDPFDKSHMWDCCEVVKALDAQYGNIEPLFDKDDQRRRMYGAPGAFRPKAYGVEYRVPSNAWVKYPKLHEAMFTLAHNTVYEMRNGRKPFKVSNASTLLSSLTNYHPYDKNAIEM